MIKRGTRILITGHQGYIGSVLAPMLQRRGYKVVGLDNGWFEDCLWGRAPDVPSMDRDIRDVVAEELRGFEAIIHLAGISNDPLGDLNPALTYEINHDASVRLAKLAIEAGVPRFLYASSCSVYGAGTEPVLTESSLTCPVTPYGWSKLYAEREIGALANDNFSPTFLRSATAYGLSPRLRGDLVVNNLVGYACSTGEVRLNSDGSAWRPLVHVEDICRAYLAAIGAPRMTVHAQIYNVGRRHANYRIREVAEIVSQRVPGTIVVTAAAATSDQRCYRVSFDKLFEQLPDFQPQRTLESGIDELRDSYFEHKLKEDELNGPRLQRILRVRQDQKTGRLDSQLRRVPRVTADMPKAADRVCTTIAACRNCSSAQLYDIHSFGDLPLADKFRESTNRVQKQPRFPLTLALCQTCGLVQIKETIAAEILFGDDYPYYSSVSQRWLAHCARHAAELMQDLDFNQENLVVELAANDGYMLRNFHDRGIETLGIDPAPGPVAVARGLGIPMCQEFFGLPLARRLAEEGKQADLIIGNNVLAHVADLQSFVSGIGCLLRDDGQAVFEMPYVRDLLEHCEFDTIYHEHLCYFSIRTLSDVFARRGLRVVDAKRLPTHGGSLRIYVRHDGWSTHELEALCQEEDSLALNCAHTMQKFSTELRRRQQELRASIQELRGQGKSLAAYGAAAKGAMLLNMCEIPAHWIEYVVDCNVHKQGKLMPGLDIPIYSPQQLITAPVDCILLLAWNLLDEIMEQQSDYLSQGGEFLVPIPGCPLINQRQRLQPVGWKRSV